MEKSLIDNKVILGLMRIRDLSVDDVENLIKGSIKMGIHFFDISDIYGRGDCESKLGEVLKRNPSLRQEMIIQTKGGIRKENNDTITLYDLSYQHIKEACYASLKRLNIDYIDYYLLHRPDILFDAKDTAKAINELYHEGKIKHFGVSNFPKEAIEYLKPYLEIEIEVNQLQLGLGHLNLISQPMNLNVDNNEGISHDSDLYYYLKKNDIVLQCWSPFQYGFFKGSIFDNPNLNGTNHLLEILGEKYHVSKCAIATAFLLKLGENIVVITGSTSLSHIKEAYDGMSVNLTKIEWYDLYKSTGNMLP
jgi:predicted oxidoreductase